MSMNKLLIYSWLIGVSVLFSWNAYGQIKGETIDKILVKVDDYIILKSELDKAYLDYLSQGNSTSTNLKCQILENLIINKLLVAKADIDSVYVTDEEVESNLDRRMQYFIAQIGSQEKIEAFYGKTIEEFKEELRENIWEQMVGQKMQGIITDETKITPAEVKQFYKSIPKDSLPYFSKEVQVGQIVHIPNTSKKQKKKVRERLLSYKTRIENGESFADLASTYSEDPGSASKGGELGFWKRGELAPEYEATALALEPGEISEPVESQFGFHLIQLIERRGNEYSSRHILIRPQSSKYDMEEAIEYLDSLRTAILQDSISFEKAAKDLSGDPETAPTGGFFIGETGSNYISVDELDPVLFFTVDTMQIGTITRPLTFKMNDGKEAVRILYLKNKTKPHQANLKDDYQKIAAAAQNKKKTELLESWFDSAKYDIFIQIDDGFELCEGLKSKWQ